MHSQNLTQNQILASVGDNSPLHIPGVPDIASITNISTSSTYNITHPLTYKPLHRHLIPEKEGNNKLVPYTKDLMSLIKIVNSNLQFGRPKLMQIFIFWYEEDVITLLDESKIEWKTDYENFKSSEKCSKLK